jgi:hypothetical protein
MTSDLSRSHADTASGRMDENALTRLEASEVD